MSDTTKIIIDTDPGIDDAMAILFAMQHPEIDLVGLTTIFGNVTQDVAVRNALVLGDLAGQAVPVARGAEAPLAMPMNPPADFVHGGEGFGDLPPMTPTRKPEAESAAEFIVRTINENPGEIVLCPVGPFTNIALALELDPTITEKVKRVVVMGGGLDRGNVSDVAEANVWNDPHAADIVFAANWDITMVGLDVTAVTICTPEHFAELPKTAPKLGGFLNEAAQFYFKFYMSEYDIKGCQMHDPAAVIACIRPDWFEYEHTGLEVVVEGEAIGQTARLKTDDRPLVKAAVKCRQEDIIDLFLSTIASAD